MGKRKNTWQDTDSVLRLFGKSQYAAQKKYRDFVVKGVGRGRIPEMTRGGLLRNIGGWGVLKSMRRTKIHVKGDERILGDSDFVEKVLSRSSEQVERRYRLKAEGWTLTKIAERVAEIFDIEKDQMVVAGKQPDRVRARGVLATGRFGTWASDGNGGWRVPRVEQIRCQSDGHKGPKTDCRSLLCPCKDRNA